MVAAVGTGFALGVPVAAFLGALMSLALILSVSRWLPGGQLSTYVLLLTGVIFNALASAVIMFLKAVVSAQKAQELLFYLMGTLSVEGTPWEETLAVTAVIVLVCLTLTWFARDLNVMSLGDDEAKSLGVDVARLRAAVVVVASVGVAISVAYTGLIGFVGLVVPHGVRLVVGPDHRILLPTTALIGGAFLVVCDLLARVSFGALDTALPVGVITACVGAPLFIIFLRRHLLRAGKS
ncbi:MAG: iron ABC transporter permease [bacterium]